MERFNWYLLLFVSVMVLVSACSRTYTISNAETKAYTKEVLAVDQVEKVKVYFRRPGVFIEVKVAGDIGQEEIDRVLESTKRYVTTDNMDDIAQQVGWGMEVSYVDLEFYTEKGTLVRQYVSRYFKTYDTTDRSPDNIDAYKTWEDVTPMSEGVRAR